MPKQFSKILAPTDFSDPSRVAVDYAVDMVAPGGTIILCHVVDDIPLTYGYVGVAVPPPELGRKLADEAANELKRFVPDKVPPGVTVKRKVLHGSAFVAIVRLAREENVDVIVMGTHGRSGLKHILIGSVAEKVVRKSPCPVLVVRPPDAQFELP
jgi:nucleotide-binding universal stress UspA family protein